jgi:hypothetical protein
MQLQSAHPSSRTRRSAAICTGKLLFSTTVPGHTAYMISSLETRSPGRLDENPENIERARADRHRDETTGFIPPEQTTSPPVEAKAFEQEGVGSAGPSMPAPPHEHEELNDEGRPPLETRSSAERFWNISNRFKRIYRRFIAHPPL